MGLCCGKGASSGLAAPKWRRREVDGVSVVSQDTTRGCSTLSLGQNMYTVTDGGNSSTGGVTQSLSATQGDDVESFFLANGLNDVPREEMDRLVDTILHVKSLESHNAFRRGGVHVASISSLASSHGSNTGASWAVDSLTPDQERYIHMGQTLTERLLRFMEVEQMSRQEIFGAWIMKIALFQLVMNRMLSTIRRCRTSPGKKLRSGSFREVLVICARDVEPSPSDSCDSVPPDTPQALPPAVRCDGRKESCPPCAQKETNVLSKFSPAQGRYQMLGLTARGLSVTGDVCAHVVDKTWDFLSLPSVATHLNAGDVYFRFVSSPVRNLEPESLELIDTFINLSGFSDETIENNVPKIFIHSAEEQNKYVSLLVKAMYLLPGVNVSQITAELLCSLDYQRNCQPGNNKFEVSDVPCTFRIVKTVIRLIFSVTIQMKVTEINDMRVLERFKDVDGIVPVRMMLLERTKRNIYKLDSTVKVRSVLLYYAVSDGVLVTHQTIVLNTSLPAAVSSLMHSFGSRGASEAVQTAKLTRQYLVRKFGDSRF